MTDTDLILSHVPFTRLRKKRVLITGGSGFVGRWMSITPPWVKITALNRQQYEAGRWMMGRWDYIIHLALTDPERVIECAKNCGAAILFSSSGAVVADIQPWGEYTSDKQRYEDMLLFSGLDVRIVRMFTFAGGWMKNRYALINMIHDGIDGERIRIRSSKASVTRSYMYAADMAIWLWRALLFGQPGQIYEVGSSYPVTMAELAREVQRNFIPPLQIVHEPMLTREPRPYYVPTKTGETMDALGVEEYTNFECTIRQTVLHYIKNGNLEG